MPVHAELERPVELPKLPAGHGVADPEPPGQYDPCTQHRPWSPSDTGSHNPQHLVTTTHTHTHTVTRTRALHTIGHTVCVDEVDPAPQ
jgi:hypothetical protein